MKKPIRVLTWHIHGNYLFYLTKCKAEFYLPFDKKRSEGYGGKKGDFPWGDNVHEIPADKVKEFNFDYILFQSKRNYETDQYRILTPSQRNLPKIYLEHDPPREQPTDTRHLISDPSVTLVHVTHFNDLMWNNGKNLSKVIEHGVVIPKGVQYTGEYDRGVVVINNLADRGRRLGFDIFNYVRKYIPLDLVGMGSKKIGGLGEIAHDKLPYFLSRYRFLFNPIRYTSLGLTICEAMSVGLPIVGLATTELATVIKNNISGFIHTNVNWLIQKMKKLIDNPTLAFKLGMGAKKEAQQRFNINRFTNEWEKLFQQCNNLPASRQVKQFSNSHLKYETQNRFYQ